MNSRPTTVCVVGLGYIGLPTAAVLADHGLRVIGLDVNHRIVETVNSGRVHIVEPDLEAVVRRVVQSRHLEATTLARPADVFLIAVPTPFAGDDHRPDLTYVDAAAHTVASMLQPGNLVILESTSPVGTTEHLAELMASLRPDLRFPQQAGDQADIQMVYCPERVLPGRILTELVSNDRLIGGLSPRCAECARDLYRTFVKGEMLLTNAHTAEMAKLSENAFRDVNIAFANELSMLCARLNVDVWELIRLANRHPRVKILQPGPGVGGHCVAVDPWFLVHAAPEQARLIRTAREVNDAKPHFVIEQIKQHATKITKPVIACLGLAFKPDVDDLRESPAVEIVHLLAKQKVGTILAAEPFVGALPPALSGQGIELLPAEEAIARAHVVVLLVNHRAFAGIDRQLLAGKAIVDTRGFWQ